MNVTELLNQICEFWNFELNGIEPGIFSKNIINIWYALDDNLSSCSIKYDDGLEVSKYVTSHTKITFPVNRKEIFDNYEQRLEATLAEMIKYYKSMTEKELVEERQTRIDVLKKELNYLEKNK